MFNGHIDTVPAGDQSLWSVDPWGAVVKDDKLFGRGACDMKGGVAAMIAAAAELAAGPRLPGDLLVTVVTDEEINGMGTIAAIRRGYRADAAIVPEPTELDVWIAFRGILVGELEVRGRSGHVEVAQPHWSLGGAVNAVHLMLGQLSWLRTLDQEWRIRPDKQHPLCSTGEINVTTVSGGRFYSNVPESCTATLNICYVPGEQDDTGYGGHVKAEVESHLARASTGWLKEQPPTLRWLTDFPPAEITADESVVQELLAVARARGAEPLVLGLDTWDDTVSLIREADMPSVSFGPGSNDQAHASDEYLELGQMSHCAQILADFARAWCATAADD